MSDNQKQLLAWAYAIIKENVEKQSFGSITVNMANGVIGTVKADINHKAPTN